MPSTFKDHFSEQSAIYARIRPGYPDELYEFLFEQVSSFGIAWDCATGNGQVALHLARRFKKVIASDASTEQLEHAQQHKHIEYKLATAEDPRIQSHSIDLVAVGTAVHWFDLPRFYAAVDVVLKSQGVLAIWSYGHMRVNNEVNAIMTTFSEKRLKPYWPKEAIWNFSGKYRDLVLPYLEISSPEFEMEIEWDLEQVNDYIRSWSASKIYKAQHGSECLELIRAELDRAWGDPAKRKKIVWPLNFRICRKP